MEKKYYAYSLRGQPQKRWQLLGEHLTNVAQKTVGFATSFGVKNWK